MCHEFSFCQSSSLPCCKEGKHFCSGWSVMQFEDACTSSVLYPQREDYSQQLIEISTGKYVYSVCGKKRQGGPTFSVIRQIIKLDSQLKYTRITSTPEESSKIDIFKALSFVIRFFYSAKQRWKWSHVAYIGMCLTGSTTSVMRASHTMWHLSSKDTWPWFF